MRRAPSSAVRIIRSSLIGVRDAVAEVPRIFSIPIAVGLCLIIGGVYEVPGTGWASYDDWLFDALLLMGSAMCAARAIREPRERAAWTMFALGLTSYAMGHIYWGIFQADMAVPPFPSVADAFWLGLFPFVFAGMWMLARTRLRGVSRRVWLDGAIVGLGLAALSAAVVFHEVATSTGGDTMVIVTNLAYPIGDLLALLVIAVLFNVARSSRDRSFVVLALGIGVFFVTDSIYLMQIAGGTYVVGNLLDIGWPVAGLLIGVAAWQQPGEPTRADGDSSITVPIVVVSMCVALMVYDHYVRMETLAVILAGATIAAAVWRLVLTYRASRELLAVTHKASQTDELTQLGNRAKLLCDLDETLAGGRPTLLAFFDLDGFKNYNDTYGHPSGDALLRRLADRLALAMSPPAEAYRMGGDEFCALIPWNETDTVEAVMAPSLAALFEQGEGFSVKTSWGHALLPSEASTPSSALSISDHRLYANKNSARVSARRQTRGALKRVLDERDEMLGIHLDDVARLAEYTARDLHLPEAEVEHVVLAAELHDVGKAAIPDAILFKPDRLDEEEMAFIQRHTLIGERILAGAPSLSPVAPIVRSSHERVDGKGYPDGLAGAEIPLAARIVFVCDAFDAMTTERPYRKATSPEAALEELRKCAGTQFDADVVEAFARAYATSLRAPADAPLPLPAPAPALHA